MATREKTVCFASPMTTALVADAVVTNLSQITLYLPETAKSFTSVYVEVGFQDVVTATGGTIGEHRVGLRLGAAAYTTFTELDDLVHSGENIAGVVGPIDFTSHFNTNWTGTSMTCDLQVYFDQTTGTTLGMNNVTAMIYITYTYDDASSTHIKTVPIMLESLVGSLPTAAANFGTNQIPQLTGAGGLLPESGVTIRDWFIVIEGNEANNNTTTDFTISANIDGGAATNFMIQEAGLGSDRYCRWIYKPSVPATDSAHNLQLWANVANKMSHVAVTLWVTYEFTPASSTRTLNVAWLSMEIASPLGSTTTAEANRFKRTLSVQEPGTITLRQSGFRVNFNCAATPTSTRWRAGAQAYRNYAPLLNVVCGMFSLQQRIDSGGAQGAGISLVRGHNDIIIDGYQTQAANESTNVQGYIIILYESDISPAGVGAHTHPVFKLMRAWDALGQDFERINSFSFSIPENNYWLTAAGFKVISWTNTSSMTIALDAECLAAEGKGAGYYDIYTDCYVSDVELGCTEMWMRARDIMKRFPNDAGPDRVNIETARDYRYFTTVNTQRGIVAFTCYHSLTWTAAGNISGNNASLPTQLQLVHADSGEVVQETTLAAGVTGFNFSVNDNTDDYFVTAYQDGTHVGRSGLAQAV